MDDYNFVLNFTLPPGLENPEAVLDALFEAGCDDATIGVGLHGMIGLDFTRAADSAEDALRSAVRDVTQAIPEAALVQAGPDLLGLTDMAGIFGFSRQNMRKYATGAGAGKTPFPIPVHFGEPSLWRLAEILDWMNHNTDIKPRADISEVAKAAAKMNFETQRRRLGSLLVAEAV